MIDLRLQSQKYPAHASLYPCEHTLESILPSLRVVALFPASRSVLCLISSSLLLSPSSCRLYSLVISLPPHCLSSFLPAVGSCGRRIKVPSGEITELKRSPFKAWSRSVYSHTCYAYCQGVLLCLFLPFWSIHLHFFQNLSRFFPCWLWLTHGSCIGPQNKIGHPAGCKFPR